MKITYTTKNNRISAEFEGDSPKDLFASIGRFQEVFEEDICGKCGHDHVKFVVRTVDDNHYHELRCSNCGARLSFGANKKGGGLFPKRKDSEGNYLPDSGWVKWNPKTSQNE
jgi:DNA-directed RNA polymerase subunit RPC12/RpoP